MEDLEEYRTLKERLERQIETYRVKIANCDTIKQDLSYRLSVKEEMLKEIERQLKQMEEEAKK